MSWSPELPIGEFRPWPDTVHVVRGRTGEMLRYVPEQAVAATLWMGTCHSTTQDDAWCFACSECGKSFPRHELHLALNHGEINYCPNCGKRVVE